MPKKLRYVAVLVVAVSIIIAVAAITNRTSTITTENKDNQVSTETLNQVAYAQSESMALLGNPQFFNGEHENETTQATTVETTTVEETTEEKVYVGLENYFQDKVVLDITSTSEEVNIRQYQSATSDVVGTLSFGETALLVKNGSEWVQVQKDGVTGFVKANLVLTGSAAYRQNLTSVAYQATVLKDDTALVDQPDAVNRSVIQAAMSGKTYFITGIQGDFYTVKVVAEDYKVLYVNKSDVIVTYLFLGAGTGTSNELSEKDQAVLSQMDLSGNDNTVLALKQQAEQASLEISIAESEAQAAAEVAAAEAAAQAAAEEAAAQEAAAQAAAAQAAAAQAAAQAAAAQTAAQAQQTQAAPVTNSGTTANVKNVPLSGDETAYAIQISSQYGVDPCIMFGVMYIESNFHPEVTNREAQGLMQIIPRFHTARMASLGVTNLYDAKQNMAVGISTLADYYHSLGDWTLALTQYRWGTPYGSTEYANMVLNAANMFR